MAISRSGILEGAGSLLAERYSDLTVDALARALRMSKSTLYRFFSSKEEVVVAVVDSIAREAELELTAAVATGAPEDQLLAVARTMARFGERLPRALVREPERMPPASAIRLRAVRAAFFTAAGGVMDRGRGAGVFRAADSELVATAFVAAAQAVLVDEVPADRAHRSEQLVALFLPGIAP